MSIRTTITLDEDLLERVKQESRERGDSFKETLNNLLRFALSGEKNFQRSEFKIVPTSMGVLPGLNYDDIEGLISYAEGEDHR